MSKKRSMSTLALAAILFPASAMMLMSCGTSENDTSGNDMPGNPRVVFETSLGMFIIELDPAKAPITVENFLSYVADGSYENTIFHRVMRGFVVQGGGMNEEMEEINTRDSIQNEADNGLENKTGTVAMARTNDPHSASSQFFINLKDNDFLNHREKSAAGWGYCVFGKVVEGMEVIRKMAQVEVGNSGMHQNVPKEPIVVKRAFVKA